MPLNDLVVLAALGIIPVNSFILIQYLNHQNAPIRTTVLQFFGIAVFVPLVFILTFTGKIGENTISALLGSFIGYVFGKSALTEEWTHPKQGLG